jgi:uncharacterized protein YktB (UPF0637 family)
MHECVPTGNPTWWNCRDNPPYARFSNFVVTTQGNKKIAHVTFKMWSNNYKNAFFFIIYKSVQAKSIGVRSLNYSSMKAKKPRSAN